MKNVVNRRKFIKLFGYGCCGFMVPSCSTVPITKRKQLTLFSEARINGQANAAYEQFKSKTKLINKGKDLDLIREIGSRIEIAVSSFFNS